MMKTPLVSIITVTFNAGKVLEKTILSIESQSNKNFEFIIIDGKSNDNTLDVIEKYKHVVSYFISEKDKGIYDAMNKGLDKATGEFVWFMNAGDQIYDSDTLEKIAEMNKEGMDVFYGETEDVDEQWNSIGLRRLKTPKKLHWRSLQMGMVVCHQSILIRKKLAKKYNLKYSISADIDWIIYALKNAKNIVNTNLILSKFQVGGMSRNNILKGLWQRLFIMVHYYGFFSTIYLHILIGIKFFYFLIRYKRF